MSEKLETVLEKWHRDKEKIQILEEKLKKYKSIIGKEMNKRNVEKLSEGNFVVSRRKNTRTYLTKDNVPLEIWNRYATKCSFDAYFLSIRK